MINVKNRHYYTLRVFTSMFVPKSENAKLLSLFDKDLDAKDWKHTGNV